MAQSNLHTSSQQPNWTKCRCGMSHIFSCKSPTCNLPRIWCGPIPLICNLANNMKRILIKANGKYAWINYPDFMPEPDLIEAIDKLCGKHWERVVVESSITLKYDVKWKHSLSVVRSHAHQRMAVHSWNPKTQSTTSSEDSIGSTNHPGDTCPYVTVHHSQSYPYAMVNAYKKSPPTPFSLMTTPAKQPTSWICAITGHRFHIKANHYFKRDDIPDKIFVDVTYKPLSHCMRCGRQAPIFTHQ